MFEINEIGYVSNSINEPKDIIEACKDGLKSDIISKIVLKDCYKDGLDKLDQFSHIYVLFKLHKIKKYSLKTYPGPMNIPNLPEVGIFASRSQYHPNNIGLRLVELIEIKENELIVRGLDAINGSPVIDIKPYIPHFDRPENFKYAKYYEW